VTNNHVVKDATKVTVTLDDGTELQAKVVGRDPRTDIAVLKVTAGHSLPYIELGQSRDVKPGEWVVAMGNPFGLGGTVTAGIVSAVSRDIGSGPYDQYIQVDAPINRGNSGGPLFTQDGKVIGMNTAIFSPTGGSVGIGFAIPSDLIRTVSAQLAQTGQVTRGFIGVEAQPLTGATAKALHLAEHGGALLAGVLPKGPAAIAGLEPGDVIQSINGQKIADPRELALTIASVAPGQDAHLAVLHDGKTRDVTVKVGQMPDDRQATTEQPNPAAGPKIGLALAPLSPELRDRLDVPEGTNGSVIREVEPGSPAEMAGLLPGDVIVSVDRHPVGSPAETVRAIRGALDGKGQSLALRILRHGAPAFVGVTLGGAQADG
jgi:serine protease Do